MRERLGEGEVVGTWSPAMFLPSQHIYWWRREIGMFNVCYASCHHLYIGGNTGIQWTVIVAVVEGIEENGPACREKGEGKETEPCTKQAWHHHHLHPGRDRGRLVDVHSG